MSSSSSGLLRALAALAVVLACAPARGQWDSYERMSVESLKAALERSASGPAQLTGKNFSNLDLRELDFRGANMRSE